MSFCSCTLFRVSWWNKYQCNYEACVSLIQIKWELSVEILTMFSVLDFFSCGVISVLRNQESVTGRSYCTLLDCLCSWGQVGHVLELIVDWLPTVPPQAKSNLASKRKVEINDTCSVKPELALLYMEYLLTHPKNRECLLSVPQKKLYQLLKALEGSKVTTYPGH